MHVLFCLVSSRSSAATCFLFRTLRIVGVDDSFEETTSYEDDRFHCGFAPREPCTDQFRSFVLEFLPLRSSAPFCRISSGL